MSNFAEQTHIIIVICMTKRLIIKSQGNPMLSSLLIHLAEKSVLPDSFIRFGIKQLSAKRLQEIAADDVELAGQMKEDFFNAMSNAEIAPLPKLANQQHYEVPAAFFEKVLGENQKYSSCYWQPQDKNLNDAERSALQETCLHADLRDGLQILELGCGWGSLTCFMAKQYPNARITAVSNSNSQREYIYQRLKSLNLNNVEIITADMNEFDTDQRFDRVVSVEMFEHMRNYQLLYAKVSSWLKPQGKFFKHIFCHRSYPYAFEPTSDDDWMSQFFFSGGFMPSDDTPLRFQDHLKLKSQWRWSGTHYEKTARAWLENMDHHWPEIEPVFAQCYGKENVGLWRQRWRIFFMACEVLFGYDNGQEWWVSHYLFEKRA